MTSVFEGGRADPSAPVALSPRAAADGGPDGGGGAGLDLSFFVSLGASLGQLVDTLRADHDRRDAFEGPADRSLFASGVAAGGTVTLDLGSVPLGRVWQIRRLVVGGVKVTTTAAGSAYAFAQGAPPSDLNITNVVDIFLTLPQGNTYGTHQLFLLPTEHLWVVFSGASNAQQYAAAARVEDWPQGDFRSTFEE